MTYSAFITDLLIYGAEVACTWADRCGISGAQQAAWLARFNRKHVAN